MHAITFQDVERLAYERVADPVIDDPGDVIVKVDAAGICGSDLHPYLGREHGLDCGTVMGHEFVGRVVETGAAADAWRAGDRVVAPFTTSCGECAACARGLTSRCARGQLFGWVQDGRGLHGAQAEYVRVPLADSTLVAVPAVLDDDALALLAGDVLSTAMFGVELARVSAGDTLAVVGCGAVGLLAVRAALARGAREVFALDSVLSRLSLASRFGAVPVSVSSDVDAAEFVLSSTSGLGVDSVIEAVGSPAATLTAARIVRVGGSIAAVGVHAEPTFPLSPGELYDRNLTYAAGRCPARRLLPSALALASEEGALLKLLVSHRLRLEDGIEAYRQLAAREEGWAKVVLRP